MRIDAAFPSFSLSPPSHDVVPHYNAPVPDNGGSKKAGGGVVLEISPEAWAAYRRSKEEEPQGISNIIETPAMCETCKNRTYQDSSNDPSVSFQTPTRLGPGQALSSVIAHEYEHVSHEQAKAEKDGREIVSQTVSIKTGICPECGRIYIAGGETRTVSAAGGGDQAQSAAPEQGSSG